jgi:hypothetical protein
MDQVERIELLIENEIKEYKEANKLLYDALLEVGDILARGIRNGEKSRNIHKALKRIREIQ